MENKKSMEIKPENGAILTQSDKEAIAEELMVSN
jgi:hypothetical protein